MSDNPCLACPVDQACCRELDWMRLSPAEFDRVFGDVADQMECKPEGPFLLVRARNKASCPRWEGQCTVYEQRPMECRLYPQAIGSVFDGREMVLSVHGETPCPWRNRLRGSDDLATDMVRALGRELARDGQPVRVVREEGPGKLEITWRRLLRKLFGFGRYENAQYHPVIDLAALLRGRR